VPLANVDPLGGVQVTFVTVQLSVAPGVNATTALHWFESVETVTFVQVSEGGCMSFTVTMKLHVFVPVEFVAVTVTVVIPTGKKNGEVTFVPAIV
jgi:hypothetical protein